MSLRLESVLWLSLFPMLVITGASSLRPPPVITNIMFDIQSPVCKDTRPFLAVVLVTSHPGNIERRRLMRDSYPAEELNALGIRRLFMLGTLHEDNEPITAYNSTSDASVREESNRFSDVLRANITDGYYAMTLKILASLKWATEHCAHARFIVKTDDDVFIDCYTLKRKLESSLFENDDSLKGHIREKPATRELWDKHYVSREDYPGSVYPKFVTGAFYATSPKTMRRLLTTAETVAYLPFEDVFLTGLVAEAAGVGLTDYADVISIVAIENVTHNCCIGDDNGVVYSCRFLGFEQSTPLKTPEQMKRYKDHGRFCYYLFCESYSPRLLEAREITCF